MAISVGSGTNIGGAFNVPAGNLLGAAGGDASIVSGLSSTSSGGSLTLASGDGNTSRGAVTINGGNCSTASGGSITISSGIGMATSFGSVAAWASNAGTVGVSGDLLLSTGTASVGNSSALDIGCEYNLFMYRSAIGSCELDRDLAQHCNGDNTIVDNRGVQPFSRQRVESR